MEEVDNIIIHSLQNINCDIDDDVQSLKDFTTELVLKAVVYCLEAIIPDVKYPHFLPASMSSRLQLATNIAANIKNLGYQSDMGYQTILYHTEIDIRRVLMFLIEKLPRDSSKSIVGKELGYIGQLTRDLQAQLKATLNKPWVPSSYLKYGMRHCGSFYTRHNYGWCYPLFTEPLHIPNTQNILSEDLKMYWVRQLPDVTKQCLPNNLIPSLLYKDNVLLVDNINITDLVTDECSIAINDSTKTSKLKNGIVKEQPALAINVNKMPEVVKLESLITEIENLKKQLTLAQEDYNSFENKLTFLINDKDTADKLLKETIAKVKIKSKSITVLSKEENIAKLKMMVDNGNERLIDLNNQWNQVQSPLLEEYTLLQSNLSSQKLKIEDEKQKLKNVKNKTQQLTSELDEKEKMEKTLIQECEKLNKITNRSAYTRRILEIISNVKKQNEEIQKILNDTKSVQKTINNLNGQLDRSFTLADELIFRDAKQDETARKAYKLLATLHKDFSDVIEAVTDLGLTERESRNLQEQIDIEQAKEITLKLEKVTTDLVQIQKETESIMKKGAS